MQIVALLLAVAVLVAHAEPTVPKPSIYQTSYTIANRHRAVVEQFESTVNRNTQACKISFAVGELQAQLIYLQQNVNTLQII